MRTPSSVTCDHREYKVNIIVPIVYRQIGTTFQQFFLIPLIIPKIINGKNDIHDFCTVCYCSIKVLDCSRVSECSIREFTSFKAVIMLANYPNNFSSSLQATYAILQQLFLQIIQFFSVPVI